VPASAPKSLAKLSTSAARNRPEAIAQVAEHLGISVADAEAWLEPIHGRTKLINAFGRLWPATPDEPWERGEFSEELGELRNSDARHDLALRVELAKILGAPLKIIEADLQEEHHRCRLDRCVFEASEEAYLAAIARRTGARVQPAIEDEFGDDDEFADDDEFEDDDDEAGQGGTPLEGDDEREDSSELEEDEDEDEDEGPLPADLADLRVSDARKDDMIVFRLADAFDVSPGTIRAALEGAHHRQRLDNVDFSPKTAPTQELLGLSPSPPASATAAATPFPSKRVGARKNLKGGGGALASYAEDASGLTYTAAKRVALPSALPARPRSEATEHLPKPGQIARCRHRNWLVEAVHAPREDRRNAAHLVDLVCIDDDAPGRQLSVLWELELGAELTEPESGQLRGLAGFDPPEHFAAYLNTLRWNATTAADATLFQAPLRAGIHVQPYQLAPLMKALELPRANLFIADDVGLGKTIEAGLVLQELLLRQRVEFALVVGPASVCLQWKEELYKRFGLHFQIYDRAFVARTRQQRGYKVNPWTTHTRFIISYPLLRRAEYLEPLRTYLGEYGPHSKRPKSLLILDEAHTVAPSSAGTYAVDSQITRIARESLCPRFENRLFLSATPHNGHSNSFSALLELLDPQRFHRTSSPSAEALGAVMIRRLKRDIRRVAKGLFPRREVVALTLRRSEGAWTVGADLHAPRPELKNYVRPHLPLGERWTLAGDRGAPELELARMLSDYEALVAPRNKRQRLVFANLQKRLLSSTAAFHRTLSAHAARFDASFAESLDRQLTADAGRSKVAKANADEDEQDGADDAAESEAAAHDSDLDRADEAVESEEIERTAAATASLGRPSEQAREQLTQMLELAGRHAALADGRVHALLEWIRRNQCAGVGRAGDPLAEADTRWGPRKLLVFTEYTDTKRWLKRLLHRAFVHTDGGDERILEIHGAIGDDKREAIQRAFNAPPGEHPVRVLLATDAAREGINLQGACADLIHFDIPWNPARLEQRNGRIDRTLQPEQEARCHYFVYAEREADIVLDAVVRKVDIIRAELGSVGSVVMEQIAKTLDGRTIRAQAGAAVEAAANPGARQQVVVDELDGGGPRTAADKRLDAEIRKAGTLYQNAVKHLGFEPDLLRQALNVALSLLDAPPLEPVEGEGGARAYRVPELPPGWESSLDALRRPRERDESLWDWRRAAPPQPVVFEPPPQMTSPRVHLHLHHPLVRRLLDVFTSAGFGAHQLEHMSLVRHEYDGHAYAVALARVSLFGSGAVRLHDELVEHIVRVGGNTAEGPLERLREREAGKLSAVFEGQLCAPEHEPMPRKGALAPLLARAKDDFAALWPIVRERGERAAEEAGHRLKARGEIESGQLRELLTAQRAQLQQQLHLAEVTGEAALRQRRSEIAARAERLTAIDRELAREPQGLRDMYEVQLCRIEPVGLVYLWPAVWG